MATKLKIVKTTTLLYSSVNFFITSSKPYIFRYLYINNYTNNIFQCFPYYIYYRLLMKPHKQAVLMDGASYCNMLNSDIIFYGHRAKYAVKKLSLTETPRNPKNQGIQ